MLKFVYICSGMVTVFCDRLGWNNLELLIGQFQSRLEFGVQRELVDLCKLLSVDGARARILFDAGIVNIAALASSKPGDIEQIIHTNTAFSAKNENTKEEASTGKKVKNIFIAGLPSMTEAECSSLMVQEARAVMKRDLGLTESAWNTGSQHHPIVRVTSPKSKENSGNVSKRIRRKSSPKMSPKVSPHLKYQLENCKAQNISQVIQRKLVSPQAPSSAKVSFSQNQCESPMLKNAIANGQEIVVTEKKDGNNDENNDENNDLSQDLFDISGMSDTFDMSSVVENIFITETETTAMGTIQKKKKKVSWGDENEGKLYVEKEITPLNSQSEATPVPVNRNVQPKTPKFKVCSEDLDLHWSGSESDTSDCVIEDKDDKDEVFLHKSTSEEVRNESNDVFGDTISDSVLVRAMDQKLEVDTNDVDGYHNHNLSDGMMLAAEGLDSNINFTVGDIDMSDHPLPVQNKNRKRKKRRQLDKGGSKNISSQILSDTDEDVVADPIEVETDRLSVVDVCSDKNLFETFIAEWKSKKEFSLAVAVARLTEPPQDSDVDKLLLGNGIVVGIGVSWSPLTCFYIHLHNEEEDLNDSLTPPDLDESIILSVKLKSILLVLSRDCYKMSSLDWRRQSSILYNMTGVTCGGSSPSDPFVASWLVDTAGGQPTLNKLVLDHIPDLTPVLSTLGSSSGYGSVSCNPSSQSARHRAVAEAVLVFSLDQKMKSLLESLNLHDHYVNIEMKCQAVLLKMELSGMGLNEKEYEDTKLLLETRLRIIEEAAYRMAGRHFSLSSPPDICKILYHELRMPVNGDPKLNIKNVRNGKGGIKLSASKEILEKLICSDYKLPGLILEHRRISSALSKTVSPLLQVSQPHPVLLQPRVYPTSITHTATGRVSLQEPNLQNIPKDFQVEITNDLKKKALGRRASSRRRVNSSSLALTPLARLLSPIEPSTTVSLRLAMTPVDGNLLLSADYSQLELRILAHLSGDQTLIDTLNQGEDVFRSMAAEINNCDKKDVTETMRQQAKQIVYGVIYGIGDKSLADNLGVDVSEAVRFVENFKSKYSKVRTFLHQCVLDARRTGQVVTLSGRKRRLGDINERNVARRSAAERQAVNTRVQGSAADLVKTAMVNIDSRLQSAWPQCQPLKWCPARDGKWAPAESRGCWLVLQLHDELIYEVTGDDVVQAALIVKEGMEQALPLDVATPVRIKVGANWGQLQDFKIDA